MLASFGVIYACKTKCYSGGHFVQGRKRKAEDEGFTQQEVPELEKELCGEGIGEDWQEAAPQKRSFKNYKGKTMTNA
jgi:hypothetical protein